MRRPLLALALACCAAFAPQAEAAAPPPARPNIVLILADDLGFSDLGCYGSEIDTPHLDGLAARGLRFTQFYNAARCCPTRAALLTGLYPHQAGVGHMTDDRGRPAYRGQLHRRCLTIAEALRRAGYRTWMVGKWHLTPLSAGKQCWPRQRGFERFYGLIGSVRSYYDPPTLTRENDPIRAPAKGYYLTDALTDEAVALLSGHDRTRGPFFLYLAYTAPHWPLHARAEAVARYRARYRAGWDELRRRRFARQLSLGLVRASDSLPPRNPEAAAWEEEARKDWQVERMAVYAAMVEALDRGVGKVLAQLRKTGAERDTLVLFLSDNGGCAEEIPASWRGTMFPRALRDGRPTRVGNDPAVLPGPADVFQSYGPAWAGLSNTPLRRYKHWVHEGGIATPLIACWPGVVRPGTVTDEVGHVIDLMPTCLEVAGARYPRLHEGRPLLPLEGKSLLPVFQGRARAGHAALFWEHEGNRAVRQGRWKLVAEHGRAWELYDLASDRTETRGLARKRPEKVKELAELYRRWAARCGVAPWEEVRPR